MAKAMQGPAYENFQVRTFLTPDNDTMFWERVDCTKQRNWDTMRGTPHWDSERYPNHRLVYIEPIDQIGNYFFYYAADRHHQDEYNWEYSEADIGGTPYNAVTRRYVFLRETWDSFKPKMGDSMPNIPEGLFGTGTGTPSVLTGYVLAKKKEGRINDQKLDSLFIEVVLTYVKRCIHSTIRYDEETKSSLSVQTNLYYGTEIIPGETDTVAELFLDSGHEFWKLSATGLQHEGRQISCNWYEITTTEVIPQGIEPVQIPGTGAMGIPLRSYHTENDYLWPAILRGDHGNEFSDCNDMIFKVVGKKRNGVIIDDDEILVRVQLANPAYRGPTQMFVQEFWVLDALIRAVPPALPGSGVSLPISEVMVPKEIEHQGVNYSVRVEPTLHAEYILIDIVGTEDPDWQLGDYSQIYPATVPFTDWPESLRVSVEQNSFRGGYRIIVITAYRPAHWIKCTPQ